MKTENQKTEPTVQQAKNIGLVYDKTKNEVRNTMGALICECLPSVIDGAYAGNYQVRMQQMVDAWNATTGVNINPAAIGEMLEFLKFIKTKIEETGEFSMKGLSPTADQLFKIINNARK